MQVESILAMLGDWGDMTVLTEPGELLKIQDPGQGGGSGGQRGGAAARGGNSGGASHRRSGGDGGEGRGGGRVGRRGGGAGRDRMDEFASMFGGRGTGEF
jgi:hypothetical protein